MAKNLLNKYVWLVDTIYKAGRITFEDINKRWLEEDMSDGVEIAVRTFHKWRIAAEELFGLVIECERKGGYHYYIENAGEIKHGGFRNWLLQTISTSNLLVEHQKLKDRILLEDIPSGQEYLSVILNAMKRNNVLYITYQSYCRSESNSFEVEPYCVKLFRQRWYLVANSSYYNQVLIYSLDRILNIKTLESSKFKYPVDFTPSLYFNNCYGIIVDPSTKAETVRLKVAAGQSNFFRSLPLHHSQKEEERNDEYSIFSYYLSAAFDFQQELFSQGDNVEVLEPTWLRQEMADKIETLHDIYNQNTKGK